MSSHYNNGLGEKENYIKNIILKFLLKLVIEFKKIEKMLDISINAYSFNISHKTKTNLNYNRYPVYISNNIKQNYINRLHFSEDNETFDYASIKDCNRFMYGITQHKGKNIFVVNAFYPSHQKKN